MRMVLEDKDLWDVTSGDEARPEEPVAGAKWVKLSRKAQAAICLALTDAQLAHVRNCKTAKETWDRLSEVHQARGLAARLFLRRKFFTLQMAPGVGMQEHMLKVTTMAEQLAAIGAPVKEEDIVMVLLCSLPSEYDSLIVSLESRADELTLDFVTSRLLHEEARRNGDMVIKEESALFSNERGKGRRKSGNNKKGACFNCGKTGHYAKECKRPAKDRETAKTAAATDDCVLLSGDTFGKDTWLVDSGASQHQCSEAGVFSSYEEITPRDVYLGDGRKIKAVGIGTLKLWLPVGKNSVNCTLTDVLHVPELKGNLVSVSKIIGRGFHVEFNAGGCSIRTKTGNIIGRAVHQNNLYRLIAKVQMPAVHANAAKGNNANIDLWHARLGHIGVNGLQDLATKHLVKDMDVRDSMETVPCRACALGKMERPSFPKASNTRATKKLELVHSDVCGPMNRKSMGGARYFVTFIDDCTRKVWLYVMRSKDEVNEHFKRFKAVAENESGSPIKALRTDNGGEYMGRMFQEYLMQHGIKHQTTAPYTPEQNGVAERMNRTIMEMARCMSYNANLGHAFWAEAVVTAAYIRNRCGTKALKDKTPEEAWTGRVPTVGHLRVFGCKAYTHIPAEKRGKLDAKATECVFLGYYEDSKAWRLYDKSNNRIIKSRDVVFVETEMARPVGDIPSESVQVDLETNELEKDVVEEPTQEASHEMPEQVDNQLNVRRSGRTRRPPNKWWPTQAHANARVAQCDEPTTSKEAMERPDGKEWQSAMREEYESLVKNKTWELVDLPQGRTPISCKWVYKIKYDSSGNIERYKARLVARGFTQRYGIDYEETFAPVVKFASLRCLLALAAFEDMELHQMDVKTAYLNGDLKEEIFMEQPEGFDTGDGKMCRLRKSLYGLKQAGRTWYEKIDNTFAELGFVRSEADHSIYVKDKDGVKTIIALYVDDLVIACNDEAALASIKRELGQHYEMKDLGTLHYCLGLRITRNRETRTIAIDQTRYIEGVLERYGMADCKSIGTPLDPGTKLVKGGDLAENEEMRGVPYINAVGSLMYAMLGTRPDIAQAVGVLSKFSADPRPTHWKAVKRVMRYLQGSKEAALTYKPTNDTSMVGFSDADWAGNLDDRRSTTGYVFRIGSGAVCWASKRQATVALSSTEAEYVALTQATKEAVWLRKLLASMGYEQDVATTIHVDNQGAIALAKNSVYHARTKHIDIQYHFVREKVTDGNIKLEYCETEKMPADALTKALVRDKHQRCMGDMGLYEHSPSGSVGRSDRWKKRLGP